jgi:hypothetical protein
MGINGSAANSNAAGVQLLPDTFRMLNEQRIELDQRIVMLPTDDPARDQLWQNLEPLLLKLREVVSDLTKAPAIDLQEVRAKAAVLAILLQPNRIDGSPIIPENETSALARSLTSDIAQLSAG